MRVLPHCPFYRKTNLYFYSRHLHAFLNKASIKIFKKIFLLKVRILFSALSLTPRSQNLTIENQVYIHYLNTTYSNYI